MAETNPIDLNKYIKSDPSEFLEAATSIEKIAVSVDKLTVSLNKVEKELDDTVKKVSSLEFGKDEAELNKLLLKFEDFIKVQKQLKDAQKAVAETSKKVKEEQKAQEGSVKALNDEARKLQKTYESTKDPAVLENFKKTSKELETQRKALNDARKEARQYAKDIDVAENSLEGLRAQLRQATRRRNKLEIDSDDFKEAQQEARVLTDRIKALDKAAGDSRINVGNYTDSIKEAFASTQNFGKGFGSAFGGAGGGASGISAGLLGGLGSVPQLAALAAALESINAIGEAVSRVNREKLEIADISGNTGEQLNEVTSQVFALSDTFKLESREITNSAKALSSQLGISFEKGLEELEKQLIEAGASSEEVLDLIREYPIQFDNAGLSIEETTKVLGAAARQGDFFADKLADSVKEIGLRLREFTPAVQKALTETLGADFAAEIEKGIKSGEPAIQLFNKIGERAKEAGLNTQQLQQLTADLGGGATEDAGGLLRVYEFLNDTLSDSNKELTDLQKRQKEQLDLQKEYNAELVRFSESFEGLGTALDNIFTGVLTSILSAVNDLIEGFGDLSESIVKTFETVEERQARSEGKLKEFRSNRLAEIKALNEEEVRNEISKLNKINDADTRVFDLERLKREEKKFGLDNEVFIKNLERILAEDTAFQTRRIELEALNKRLSELRNVTEETTKVTDVQTTADKKAADSTKKRNEALKEAIELAEKQLDISARTDLKFAFDNLQESLNKESIDPLSIDVDIEDSDEEEEALTNRNNTLNRLASRFRRERLKNQLDDSKSQMDIEKANTQLLKDELDERIELLKKFDGFSEELLIAQKQRKDLDRQEEQKKRDEEAAKIINTAQLTADILGEITNATFERRQELEQRKFDAINQQFEREIEAAEGNEFLQNEIRERQEQAERKFLEEQARREKNQAIFTASLNFALALGRAVITGDFAGAALAGTQLGIVIATPIPSFAEGTENAPGGIAELAEEGRELVKDPQGNLSLADKRGLYNVKKGSTIFTNAQTEQILRDNQSFELETTYLQDYQSNQLNIDALVNKTQEVKDEIGKIRFISKETHITSGGIQKIIKDAKLNDSWRDING